MKELELIQGTKEWHAWRQHIIGGSDAPVIDGVNPWKNINQLWEEKVGLRENNFSNEDTQRGIELEPTARLYLQNQLGKELEPRCFEHQNLKWMGASIDGISKDRKTAVEIKCPRTLHHEIPFYYIPQLQHAMEVCELDQIIYCSFKSNDETAIFTVRRDDKHIQKLKEKEEEFYKWIVTFCPPPQSYVERRDSEWIDLCQQYLQIESDLKLKEIKKEEIRQRLIVLSGGSNVKGGGLKLSKEVRKGSIDYSKIPLLEGIDLENFRKSPIECWKISK